MASSNREDRWKDLDVTKDEIDRIGNALKDEKFRKMFVEYAEEIADPKNRELYEKEIAQMEAEKGMDVQFIHPKPGHVLKIKAQSPGSSESAKVFVNICQNEFMGLPSNEKKVQLNGNMGLQWSIPHSFSPAKEDLDKKGERCAVYDVVFHPDTYKMASNPSFLKLIHDTALDGLERQFGLNIDRASVVRFQQMKFKGRPEPTIMRKKKEGGKSDEAENNNNSSSNKENDPLESFPYPYEQGVTSEELAKRKAKQVEEQNKRKQSRVEAKSKEGKPEEAEMKDGAILPHYTITNQYGIDMADFSQSLSGTQLPTSNSPSAIVVSIHLPKLKSAAPCQLDVTERNLSLQSNEPIVYKLSIKLPYPVDDENGSAKFDKTKKELVVTLPVIKKKMMQEVKLLEATNDSATQLVDEAGDCDVNSQPLIEVLEPSAAETPDSSTKEGSQCTSTNEEEMEQESSPSLDGKQTNKLTLDSKILYKVPTFTFDQEDESVTLVLNVASINKDGFYSAYHENTVELMFSTVSRTGFPTHYYLQCIFPSAVANITTDFAEKDAVLTIIKDSSGLWESFESNMDSSSPDVKVNEFVTKAELEKELAELEKSEKPVEAPPLNLTIDVKPTGHRSEELLSPEVVHTNDTPSNIPGILKRTVSESSADDLQQSHGDSSSSLILSSASNSNSPVDLPSPRERKKSVSFNDKVEETMFKSKDSVCQMHKTLVNRRKKQRQRQNRREENIERRRRNSSTENNSSAEESSKKKGRRRRHSSSTSDDGNLSPRVSTPNQMGDSSVQYANNELCTCDQNDEETEQHPSTVATETQASSPPVELDANNPPAAPEKQDDLNSDDDDEREPYKSASHPGAVTNWSETSQFVEKTKCAFNFQNSVIFDLDE